jgi:hypothetical protein
MLPGGLSKLRPLDSRHRQPISIVLLSKMAPECSHMTTICHFPFWFQWKHLSRLPKLWNFHLGDSKCFQIKFITNNFFHWALPFSTLQHTYNKTISSITRDPCKTSSDWIRVLVAVANEILKRESSKCILDLPRVERRGTRIVTLG